jgi:CubicO group peptidase (beta-lactamase class C family)
MLKKLFKSLGYLLLAILIIVNLFILITGKTYLYKGIANTYLKGRTGPDITDLEVFENREVSTGTPQPWNHSKKYNNFVLTAAENAFFDSTETEAYLVIKNDSIVFEKYWTEYNSKTISNSFSVAKSVISILIGIAIDEGLIKNVHQKVSDFIPEFKKEGLNKVSIYHLLTMSSGLSWMESGKNPFSHNAAAYFGTDLKATILKQKLIKEPGKQFEYLSGNTQILAFILKEATHKTVSDYASEKLWKPMGAEVTAEWSLDTENGTEKAFCCLYATAKDFARIGKLFLQKGKWNGKQIVSEQYVNQSITPAKILDEWGKLLTYYGYQWWLIPNYKGYKIHYARGILGQYIINIPAKNTTIVRLGHKRLEKTDLIHPDDVYYNIDIGLKIAD